ncbi:hypothetical protein ESCO_005090 [Escovopsis weberi]|uniref:Uncharacterized protein n=1 Tax=Escovopsis weberi TaxID=150374 RepID=A0A0M9VVW8_ESCWE|nr:hypothetical protein ESCO_005090 [Escovopsis weberi]
MSSRDQQENGPAGKKRAKRSKLDEAPHNYHYDLSAANGAGTCAMAASFCEVLQDSRLQHQLGNTWGPEAPYNQAMTAASSPLLSTAASTSSSGASSPHTAPVYPIERPEAPFPRKGSQIQRPGQGPDTLDPRSFRAVVGIQTTRSPDPSEGEFGDAGDAVYEPDGRRGTPASQSETPGRGPMPDSPRPRPRDQQMAGQGFAHGDGASRREYLGGLNAELNNLRMHLLQRANGAHVP